MRQIFVFFIQPVSKQESRMLIKHVIYIGGISYLITFAAIVLPLVTPDSFNNVGA